MHVHVAVFITLTSITDRKFCFDLKHTVYVLTNPKQTFTLKRAYESIIKLHRKTERETPIATMSIHESCNVTNLCESR